MKKNRMLRLASMLMILTLLTTSVVGGTFAKYVTKAEGTDTARVAKWGITMKSDGSDVFVDTYDGTVATSVTGEDVVAPGTTKKITYEVDGKPETDYEITFDGAATKEIYLGAGTYTYVSIEGVTYDSSMNATLGTDDKYYPLEWSVKIATDLGTVSGSDWTAGDVRTFATLAEAMTALSGAKVSFDANEACDVVVTIAWEWDFDSTKSENSSIKVTGHVSKDNYDTILGDIAAGNGYLSPSTDAAYSTRVGYTLKMIATQID